MTPAVALAFQGASALATGLAGRAQARGEQQRAQNNAYIGRTRAMQTDTAARTGLETELGQIRNVLAANQQRAGVGVMDMLSQLRDERDRERRIEFGNRMAEAADWRMQAANARAAGSAALISGIARAGGSLFDYAQLPAEMRTRRY